MLLLSKSRSPYLTRRLTMALFSNLIKTNNKNGEKASRRSSNDSTVPSSISFRLPRRSSVSNSLPDTNEGPNDASRRSSMASSVPDTTERICCQQDTTASFMEPLVHQRRRSPAGPPSLNIDALRGNFSDYRSQSQRLDTTGSIPAAPMLTRSDSWGCLSVEHLMYP